MKNKTTLTDNVKNEILLTKNNFAFLLDSRMTNNKQQTPVESLQEIYDSCPAYEEHISYEDFEQAKKMEKERMIDFALLCMFGNKDVGINLRNDFVRKYNEIYGGGE